MDISTHQPTTDNPQPAPPAPAPAPPAGAPQEATGDSESDGPVLSALTGGDRCPSVAAGCYAEDDAESCSGAGDGDGDNNFVPVVDDDGRGADDDVAMEGDESEDEVDSRMCGPWWRRTTVQLDAPDGAGAGAGGGCARLQEAAVAVVAGPGHTAESNRLFWEACIAHGY